MIKHGRDHKTKAEFHRHQAIFQKNLELINIHNSDPTKSYEQGINKFSDYSTEEISRLMNKINPKDFKITDMLEDSEEPISSGRNLISYPAINWTQYFGPVRS